MATNTGSARKAPTGTLRVTRRSRSRLHVRGLDWTDSTTLLLRLTPMPSRFEDENANENEEDGRGRTLPARVASSAAPSYLRVTFRLFTSATALRKDIIVNGFATTASTPGGFSPSAFMRSPKPVSRTTGMSGLSAFTSAAS